MELFYEIMKYFILAIVLLVSLSTPIAAQNNTDIRKVDFSNYTHKIGQLTVSLKNGLQPVACSKDADGIASGDVWSLEKAAVQYGDLDGDGRDEAFMPMVANICGGNMITNEAVLVYKIEKGKIVKLPEFDYFDEGCETGKTCDFSRSPGVGVSYDAKLKAIIVETSFSTGDDALCCPSLRRRAWFGWNGAKFVESQKSKIEKVEKEGN